MRYYLDTNILAFLMTEGKDALSRDVRDIIDDCTVSLYTSTICVMELIHLCQIGKISGGRHSKTNPERAVRWISEYGIAIVPVTAAHLERLAALPMREDHRDPEDRTIIAQSISDHIPIVSSDRKFRLYEKDGLQLVFNRR